MSESLIRQESALMIEGVALDAITVQFDTPTYVYSRAALTANCRAYAAACGDHNAHVQYAMKANSNLAVLQVFAQLGAGFDIVSVGELRRVLAAGAPAAKVVFSGAGKSADEMRFALKVGMVCFNVESIPELHRLNNVAASVGKVAPVSPCINPDVDAKTHPYILTGLKGNKFSVAFDRVLPTYRAATAMPNLRMVGVDCHIGPQITEVSPYLDALDKVLDAVTQLDAKGIRLAHIDVGGGLGIMYTDEMPPNIMAFVRTLLDRVEQRGFGDRTVLFEPGRSLVGNAGLLLTRVEYPKPGASKNFCIVGTAMDDLVHPATYGAYHHIVSVHESQSASVVYDVVGPVCESGDWLGRDRSLAVQPGDVLAILLAGTYDFTMSSNYNTRNRAAEVTVDGDKVHLTRGHECFEDLTRGGHLSPV